jgi:hypothetical protein
MNWKQQLANQSQAISEFETANARIHEHYGLLRNIREQMFAAFEADNSDEVARLGEVYNRRLQELEVLNLDARQKAEALQAEMARASDVFKQAFEDILKKR